MAEADDVERDLQMLGAELRKLEAEYNMFFAGRVPRPPWETRSRVETLLKRLDRTYLDNVALRFRFSTLQARFTTFAELWDRGMRAREEGRAGPLGSPEAGRSRPSEADVPDKVLHVAAFSDPLGDPDKLEGLYESLKEARMETGEDAVPFHRFAELIKDEVRRLKGPGSPEVAFRVALKDGKVKLTARALKGVKD